MSSTSPHSARKELRAIFERAVRAAPGLPEPAVRRVVNRLMRQQKLIVELGGKLHVAEQTGRAKPPREAAFDPYAFGAVVTLQRLGRDGLMERLAAIESTEHLKALAHAQHLPVDGGLVDASELRAAIVRGAERRIAERRAAAG
jgi:hypothetical protein